MSIKPHLPALPSVAITETDRLFKITVDMSDLHVSDTAFSVSEDTLVIDMISEHEQGQSYYLGEMQAESYRRIIPLGFETSEQAISKNCDNGVLEIRVPKPARKETTNSNKAATIA
ncbi:MAG: Hsp20/alpha crystallin family protein [Granulosicoccus sp.]